MTFFKENNRKIVLIRKIVMLRSCALPSAYILLYFQHFFALNVSISFAFTEHANTTRVILIGEKTTSCANLKTKNNFLSAKHAQGTFKKNF